MKLGELITKLNELRELHGDDTTVLVTDPNDGVLEEVYKMEETPKGIVIT